MSAALSPSVALLLLARFNTVLDGELAALSLPPALVSAVDAERNKLAAADFSAFALPLREALRRAFDRSACYRRR